MNTHQRTMRHLTIAVSMSLTIAILTSVALAAPAEVASSGSFDQLSAAVLGSDQAPSDQLSLTDNAIVATGSPVGGTAHVLRSTYTVQLTGYNSEVAQTDSNPFITASGTHVRDGVVASNMFPFGTAIKIPSLYGNKIFVVEDRMNTRYQDNVDIWFANKSDALALGRRTVQIVVLK